MADRARGGRGRGRGTAKSRVDVGYYLHQIPLPVFQGMFPHAISVINEVTSKPTAGSTHKTEIERKIIEMLLHQELQVSFGSVMMLRIFYLSAMANLNLETK